VGIRYEFHPINNGSPYQDNACTATHEVAGGPVPEAPRQGGSVGWWRWLAVAGVVVVASAVVVVGVRRRAVRKSDNSS
jgi:hypothetical protein